jgi:uncharacterized protein with ATP-grasp and redox domains
MKTNVECMICNIKQLLKVSKRLNVDKDLEQKTAKQVFEMMSQIEFNESNPLVMSKTWDIVTRSFNNANPYKELKQMYNELLLSVYDETDVLIQNDKDAFKAALKMSIIGNLIDLGAKHTFTKQDVLNKIKNYKTIELAIDSSQRLKEQVMDAQTLLYIGDNCGEIVLDKLFIKTLKRLNADLTVYFAVRGGPIINDVTIEDAKMVHMEDVAHVISSGVAAPGTLLEQLSDTFVDLFHQADVVIAKGQGNYESLSEIDKDNLFLVLMAKCELVANTLGVGLLDIVVKQNKLSE